MNIDPDEHVKAMDEINAAARMRVAANEKAEAEGYEAEPSYVYGLRHSVLEFSVKIPGQLQ